MTVRRRYFTSSSFSHSALRPRPLAKGQSFTSTVNDSSSRQRTEPALPLIDEISSLLNRFPAVVSTQLFGSMLKGVDFVTSNVPGPPFETYASGGLIEEIYGFGPLTGAAANITLFSYCGRCGVGISTDQQAVPDPDFFRECLEAGIQQVLDVA